MSENYTPKSTGLPPEIQGYIRAFLRTYPILKEMADMHLASGMGINTDGQPHGTGTSDPTALSAEKRERILDDIRIIEESLDIASTDNRSGWVSDFYKRGLMQKYTEGRRWNQVDGYEYAGERTWGEKRDRLFREIARRKGLAVND